MYIYFYCLTFVSRFQACIRVVSKSLATSHRGYLTTVRLRVRKHPAKGDPQKAPSKLSPCFCFLFKNNFELWSIHMISRILKVYRSFFCSKHIFSVEHSHGSKRLSLTISTILASGVHWSRYDAGGVFAWARPSSLHESRSGAQTLF